MARAADTPNATGIQRGRGGFMRNAAGIPFVTDPNGATTAEDGTKPELIAKCVARGIEVPAKITVAQLHELLGRRPKRVAYGSPSNRGKQIENTTNLVKWGERRVVLGFGADPDLAHDCARLTTLDVDSDEYKTLADAVILRAKEAAKANLAAQRGTHGHALTEDHDEDRDWIVRAEAGEDLGLDTAVQQALVAAWRDMLDRTGLEILAVEASCVDDTWRLAGTLDRIARTTRQLRFALVSGEVVEIPAGTVLVLDVKTGQRRTDRNGAIIFWQAYAIQIASYAQSVPYDLETETRGEWAWPISQEHALIAHLDVAGALEGNAACELVYVDLVAGREHGGETVVQAKAWEQRSDVFSVAHLAQERTEEPATSVVAPDETTVGGEPLAPPTVTPFEQHEIVRARAADDGDSVDDLTFGPLQAAVAALDADGRAWIMALTRQAMQANVSFHAHGHRTLRRYEIIRGLTLLAQRGEHDDDTVRDLLEPIIGDCAQFTSVPVGHLVGSLSAQEAAKFSGLVDGRYSITIRPDGRPTLATAA